MAGIMKRILKVSESKSHALLDSIENPSEMAHQAIRDLKKSLNAAISSLAEVRALCLQSERKVNSQEALIAGIDKKIEKILLQSKQGKIAPEDADSIAVDLIKQKNKNVQLLSNMTIELERHGTLHSAIEGKIEKLKTKIREQENDLIVLKARLKTAEAVEDVSKHFSNVDPDDSIATLDRIKQKVEEKEAIADSYSQIADEMDEHEDLMNTINKEQEELEAIEELDRIKSRL